MACLGKIQSLTGFGDESPSNLEVPVSYLDARSGGLGLGQLCVGQPELGFGGVMRPRYLVGPTLRSCVLRGQFRESVVLLLGKDQVRFAQLDGGLGLLDGFVDFIGGELQVIFCTCLLGPRSGKSLLGDINLQGHFLFELGQAGFLTLQLRFRQVEFASGLLHLISVVDRLDLRQYLALLHLVILFDQEPDNPA